MKSAVLFFALSFFSFACQTDSLVLDQIRQTETAKTPRLTEITSPEIKKLLESAVEQTKVTRNYTGQYYVIPYPNGDVPIETGACTDVIIRAFRKIGIDLQKEVHEDMAANFALYPTKWGMEKTDSNIDHRRVLNLQTFFKRQEKSLPITENPKDYQPGDIVAWDLDGKGMTHIGIVSNQWNEETRKFSIIHNIGGGANQEDRLFEWKIIGHYRYF